MGFDIVITKRNMHEVAQTLRFCRDNNIILIEIEEGLDPSEITNQIIEQIKEQTGTQLSYRQLTRFRNFIGNTRNP